MYRAGCSDKILQEMDLDEDAKAVVKQVPMDVLESSDPLAHEWLCQPAERGPDDTRHGGADASDAADATEQAPCLCGTPLKTKQRICQGCWQLKRHLRARQRREDVVELLSGSPGDGDSSSSAGSMDGLLVVAGEDDAALVEDALAIGVPRLGAGGRLVVFGHNLQPLSARQGEMRADGNWVDVRLIQLFTREYQVLPKRTHPNMAAEMQHCDGFLLVGTRVDRGAGSASDVDERPAKRRRH